MWGRGVCGGWGVYGQGVCAWRWGREGCACLRIWCAGRDRGDGESHSQAKDNAVCVCVGGGGVGGGGGEQCVVCGVPCVRAGCEPAGWVCVCLGSGCVCARCAGGVCVRVCVWCVGCRCGCGCGCGLWVRGVVAQRQRPRDTARQRTRQCVCGRGGRDVYRGVVCAVVAGSLWAGVGGAVIVALRAGLGVCGLSMWRVGRERGEAESHSRRVTAGPRTT